MSLASQLKKLIDKYGADRVEEALSKLQRINLVSLRDDLDAVIDNWAKDNEEPTLFKMNRSRKAGPTKEAPIEKTSHTMMYALCYSVETAQQSLTLDSTQRGRVASVLGKLSEAGADLSQLNHFEEWWKTTWKSKDKHGTYYPPRPEQVLEFWWVATRAINIKRQQVEEKPQPPTQAVVIDFEERMRLKALERRK